jgi:hypothetical protein
MNCRTGVMKISVGNMTLELNIFNINNQPLDYDEASSVCLIEEITDEPICEFSLEDPMVEYFVQDEDDLNLDRLIEQDVVLHEFCLKDHEMQCFVSSGGDLDFSMILQQADIVHEPCIEDPEIEYFAQCGGDIDFDKIRV